MRRAIIVSSPNAYRMNTDLLAEALGCCLQTQGFDVLHLTRESKPHLGGRKDDLFFFLQLGIPEMFRVVPGTKILFVFHPTCPNNTYGRHAADYFRTVRAVIKEKLAHAIFDYNPQTTKWMQNDGLPAFFCPIGYHEVFDNTAIPEIPSKIKAHFIGRARGPRNGLSAGCGAKVHVDLWGEARRRYTRLEGVHLSLASYQPFRTCLTLRLIVLLASNRRTIVHQTTDWCPLIHGEHCLIGKPDELADLVHDLQENQTLAKKLASNAYEFVRREHRLDTNLIQSMRKAGIV